MPCRDYYDDHPHEYYGAREKTLEAEIRKLRKQIAFAESALCATLKAGHEFSETRGRNFYTYINFEDAGITSKELSEWERNHRALDEKHRAEAAAKAAKKAAAEEKKKLKEAVLAKLTPEEKEALGVK